MRRPWRLEVTEARRARLGDAGCFLVALVIGGLASDATAVEATRSPTSMRWSASRPH